MNSKPAIAIVLAAGRGTRMKSSLPKVMHPLAGRPMILNLIATLESSGFHTICVVVGEGMDMIAHAVSPHVTAIQHEPKGTGHAALSAKDVLTQSTDDILVLFGADPLITENTLKKLMQRRQADDNPAVVVLGFRPENPDFYGRLVCSDNGELEAIVEHRDASEQQRTISLCNAGTMIIDGSVVWSLLQRIGMDNAKGEYYLTDLVAIARADGRLCGYVEGSQAELMGVDSRADLAAAEALMQDRLRTAAMAGGASLIDPETVFFSFDTIIGRDVVVEPHVFFGPGVIIEDHVTIKGFSHLEGATIQNGAIIGPYARLRPGTVIEQGAKVGNFVEIKNAVLGPGAKASHLSYIGDASIGAKANIGAGTITCNYDGFNKSRTVIGAGAFIGSNSALVAPLTIGEGAIVAAGSTITKDVQADSLAINRADQKSIAGWATRFRQTMTRIIAKKETKSNKE